MSASRTGYCSHCGRKLALKKDGTVRDHNRNWTITDRRQTWCEGSGAWADRVPRRGGENSAG